MKSDELAQYLEAFPVVMIIPVGWRSLDEHHQMEDRAYFDFFQRSRERFLERVDLPSASHPTEEAPLSAMLRSLTIDFESPLEYPDKVRIGTRLDNVSDEGFELEGIIVSHQHPKIVARCRARLEPVARPRGTSAPLPDAWREALRDVE